MLGRFALLVSRMLKSKVRCCSSGPQSHHSAPMTGAEVESHAALAPCRGWPEGVDAGFVASLHDWSGKKSGWPSNLPYLKVGCCQKPVEWISTSRIATRRTCESEENTDFDDAL